MSSSLRRLRLLGVCLLFAISGWYVHIQWVALSPGHLNAGDDHVHLAIANELSNVVAEEHRILSWNNIYGPGVPMFLLRPPGFYMATVLTHHLTSLTVEQSAKLLVVLALGLYPLSIFWGCRLLNIGFAASLYAAALSPLAISTWGHTIDAYHYLGVHKQLLAILMFPLAVGTLWRLVTNGRYGYAFIAIFPMVFLTHPYVAYTVAILFPAMLIAVLSRQRWNWVRGLGSAGWCALPALLILSWWAIPFFSSEEVQHSAPFFSSRKFLDVVVCTASETLRQLFLGGILDTSRWSGALGQHEWGWRDNGAVFRFPIVTALCLLGLWVSTRQRRFRTNVFVSLAFMTAFVLFTGPDDFPLIDHIPFAIKFQNIHSIFVLEWACFVVGGIGCHGLISWAARLPSRRTAVIVHTAASLILTIAWLSAARERTVYASQQVDIKRSETHDGQLVTRATTLPAWLHFQRVSDLIRRSGRGGAVAAVPGEEEDTVVYNLLPHIVNRPMYLSGFEDNGGVYQLLSENFRHVLLKNYPLQRLFNIGFSITSAGRKGEDGPWPETLDPLYNDKHWRLFQVKGEATPVEALAPDASWAGFIGTDEQWAALMLRWLRAYADGSQPPVWIVHLIGLSPADTATLASLLSGVVLGKGAVSPVGLASLPRIPLDEVMQRSTSEFFSSLAASLRRSNIAPSGGAPATPSPLPVSVQLLRSTRSDSLVHVASPHSSTPVLMKRSFYRSWRVSRGEHPLPLYRVSPGLQLTIVPAGESDVRWHYPGPNRWRWSTGALGCGLVLALFGLGVSRAAAFRSAFRGVQRRLLVSTRSWGRRSYFVRRWLPSAIWVLFLTVLVWKVVSESVLRIPVTIHPRPSQVVNVTPDDGVELYWNFMVGRPREGQVFTLEVARDRGFDDIIKTVTVSGDHTRLPAKLTPDGRYYFRARFEGEKRAHAWSSPVSFSVQHRTY